MGDEKDDYEKLFLLEVLVDNLTISNSKLNLDKKLETNLADTCVFFQFLHYPPLVVCESDFIGSISGTHDSSHVTFKSGKSCFFSLRSPKGHIRPVPFDIKVKVTRKLKPGVLPDKLDIGKAAIDMSDDFTDLLRQNTDDNYDVLPLTRNKKGVFEIKNESGITVGNLTAFIRLSCFGKLIITQFSLNKEDEKSYLFKGTDVKKMGLPTSDAKPPQIEKVSEKAFSTPQQLPANRISEKREILETSNPQAKPYDQRPSPGKDAYGLKFAETKPCGCPIDFSCKPPAPLIPSSPYPSPSAHPSPSYPPHSYAAPSFPPSYPSHSYYPPRSSYPPPSIPPGTGAPTGRGNLCDCAYPVPPSVMSKYTQRTEKNLGLAPGEVGMQHDQVIFQLPLKKQGEPLTERDKMIDSSVHYKLTSSEETKDGSQKNTVHVKTDDLPGMAGKGAVGPVSGLPVDDGHDVFLLKIGKKCDGDKKRNLELELRTPKMKEPKPRMVDQDTQYLESDVPKDDGKGKKKGEKGGKGDKGGKGGKGRKT